MPNCKVPITNAVEVVWNWSVGSSTRHNVTHLNAPVGFAVTTANAQLFANALGTHITQSLLVGHFASSIVFNGVSLRDLRSVDQPLVPSSGPTVPGTATGESLPPQVSEVVTLRTAKVGRANRGRIYLPPLDEGSNDASGRIAAAAKTALDGFAQGLLSVMSQGGAVPAVLGRPLFNRTDCTVLRQPHLENWTACVVRDTRFDSQRRRSGRG